MIACGDLGVNLLMRMSAGMSPRNNLFADLVIAPIGVLVGAFYNYTWVRREQIWVHASLSTLIPLLVADHN